MLYVLEKSCNNRQYASLYQYVTVVGANLDSTQLKLVITIK